jgi:Ca-activated chloride channel family protein
VACATLVAAGVVLRAQDAVFRNTSNLVSVYATVTRADGQHARGLDKDDFQLFDNGEPRPIAVFSNDSQPMTVALVVDESGSMLARLPRVRAAAEAFVGAMTPGDRASFSTLTHRVVPLTGDRPRLIAAIREAAAWPWWDSGSPIWGALDRGITDLAAERGRRVLVILTDGQDTPDVYTHRPSQSLGQPIVFPNAGGESMARRALKEEFMLYALGFQGAPFENDLKTIARQSGGGFTSLAPADDLATVFRAIVDDLHRQYVLGFVPAEADGVVHTIEVRSSAPGTTVRARERYLAD